MSERDENGGTEMGVRMKVRVFPCPHCHEPIQVVVESKILGLQKPGDSSVVDPHGNLTAAELEMIRVAKEGGIFGAFEVVVRQAKAHQLPRSMERFFVTFMRTARHKNLPRYMLDYFIEAFRPARIDFWVAQGIGVVLVNGVMRHFMPTVFIDGGNLWRDGGVQCVISQDERGFDAWIRTRWGLVEGPGALFEALKKRSIGEFARTITAP